MKTIPISLILVVLLLTVPVAALAQTGDGVIAPAANDAGVGSEIAWILGALVVGVIIGFGIAVGIRDRRLGAAEARRGRKQSLEEYLEQQREVVNRW